MKTTKILVSLILLILIYFSLSGCSNELDEVKEVTAVSDTLPGESAYNVVMHYSEKGHIQFTLKAEQLDRYSTVSPYIEFPKGLHVMFYDSIGGIKSELTANYAISYEGKKFMEARDDVVVINHEKNQTLNTEYLQWDQKKHIIFTDVFVKITTDEHVIFGKDGFESDEEFNRWTIRTISGKLDVES